MKVLSKENQQEIGFDIDCLPEWHNFMFKNGYGAWFSFVDDEQSFSSTCEELHEDTLKYLEDFLVIPRKHSPTNFKSHWTDSLFKIKRYE